jgi:hypothetical protein
MEISCSDNVIATHPGHFVKWPHIHGPPSSLMYFHAALIKYAHRARRSDGLHLAGIALYTAKHFICFSVNNSHRFEVIIQRLETIQK